MAQRKVYYIPDNFVDDEKIFGGKFRKRNFIEAVIFTLPVLGLFWLINWATGIGWGTLFYPTFLFGIATFFLFIIGYNGDSWGETLLLAQKFRSNKFNISTYNPRVKTELTADYLANPNANSKAEAIRNFIKNLNDVLAGARGQSEIADDLTSDKTILWYVEDEGIIEKPESLKTAAEIKQEEKDAKKAAKLEKKKQKEYLSTLGPKERKIAKARFKAQALEKAERDRKRREEELRIYNEAIAKREKEEAEKAKEEGVVKTESGLLYKVVKEGKGDKVQSNQRAKVSYKGTLIDGTQFDANASATFSPTQVVKGFGEGLQLMQKGGKYILYIPAELGYGVRGGGDKIPTNSTLIFEVEVLDIVK